MKAKGSVAADAVVFRDLRTIEATWSVDATRVTFRCATAEFFCRCVLCQRLFEAKAGESINMRATETLVVCEGCFTEAQRKERQP